MGGRADSDNRGTSRGARGGAKNSSRGRGNDTGSRRDRQRAESSRGYGGNNNSSSGSRNSSDRGGTAGRSQRAERERERAVNERERQIREAVERNEQERTGRADAVDRAERAQLERQVAERERQIQEAKEEQEREQREQAAREGRSLPENVLAGEFEEALNKMGETFGNVVSGMTKTGSITALAAALANITGLPMAVAGAIVKKGVGAVDLPEGPPVSESPSLGRSGDAGPADRRGLNDLTPEEQILINDYFAGRSLSPEENIARLSRPGLYEEALAELGREQGQRLRTAYYPIQAQVLANVDKDRAGLLAGRAAADLEGQADVRPRDPTRPVYGYARGVLSGIGNARDRSVTQANAAAQRLIDAKRANAGAYGRGQAAVTGAGIAGIAQGQLAAYQAATNSALSSYSQDVRNNHVRDQARDRLIGSVLGAVGGVGYAGYKDYSNYQRGMEGHEGDAYTSMLPDRVRGLNTVGSSPPSYIAGYDPRSPLFAY